MLGRGQGEVGAEWRARWRASTKTGSPLFDGPVMDWNINQVALVFWSNFYDSIYEHPERPTQKIIDNDDLLDKWVEDQAKKMEDRAKKNSSSSTYSKTLDHDEVIVFDNDLIEELDEEDAEDEELVEEYYEGGW